MARKDQLSSKEDRCDICGAGLDDDAVIQEFPDGSVVKLCNECANAAPPEEEEEVEEVSGLDEATVEWSGPDEERRLEAADFDSEDFEPEAGEPGSSRAAAELAAWVNAPSADEDDTHEEDLDLNEDFNEKEAEAATLQLMAAIAEADMAEEEAGETGAAAEAAEAEAAADYGSEAYVQAEAPPGFEAEAVPEEDEAAFEPAEAEEAAWEPGGTTNDLPAAVTDLLSLQTEMQSALARLSDTLEHFVTEMVASEERTSAIADRVQELEGELESTRERLRVAESLLPETSIDAVSAVAAATAAIDTELAGPEPGAWTPGEAVSPPPPLPAAAPAPGKSGKHKVAAAVPPPLGGMPPFGVVPPAGAPLPPPLPGLPGAGPAPMVPPPFGAVPPPFGAVPPAGGATPPPLPGLGAARPVGVPPMTAAPPPTTTPPPVARAKAPAPAAPAAQAAPSAPPVKSGLTIPSVKPAALPRVPGTGMAAGAAAAGAAALGGGAAAAGSTPSVPLSAALQPQTDVTPHARPVAGAAAAMQKFLRSRKGHHHLEPEPEVTPAAEPAEEGGLTFTINEVQVAQRYFNESEFTRKIAEISKSIGKPKANVSRTEPGAPEAAITVFWDIVWYQYLVDLRKDLPSTHDRVSLEQEGMDLEELEPRFREKNATVNDDGRLDASELEVRLLSDPSTLITEMEVSEPETRLADDATEEVWDQQSAPEFRWD